MLPDDVSKKSSVTGCPVPSEQQPLNEYRELSESWFFRWAMLDLPAYLRKMAWVWGWSWAIAGPVAAASFPPAKYPVHFFVMGAGGASLLLCLVLLRLYLGWAYISSRLSDSKVFYEESGWYDGQIWSKPPEVQLQDRLVVTYEVKPLLQRLRKTLSVFAVSLLGGTFLWAML
ncbi:CGLD27 family protein [Leptothermofonsia sichuanensis E412]|uniref:CGLD27 family protein n=1 Tax=Leptothermofonsia sichuanensis TaxID=2917832 RepID=UPI001CA7A8A8|nr:CGLD27 family protein [Leptothermofonsia sichuanensis]QZZ20666.1 CGLD27 family protein [Leptothermofonsia sichuanensis E412]